MNKLLASYPVIILCGGSGTRLREQTEFLPKPMIPIGGRPMIDHIIRWYRKFGCDKFILALGYKQEVIKHYFANYDLFTRDHTVDIGRYRGHRCEDLVDDTFSVTLSDTGEHTLKGGRLSRVRGYIKGCETFFMTYGDGIGDIDIEALLRFHLSHKKIATVTGVVHPPRFGEIVRDGYLVTSFSEKSCDPGKLINAGFFVFSRRIFSYVDDEHDLETSALRILSENGELAVYTHAGQWMCMDNQKDVGDLQDVWNLGLAKWRTE